MKINRVFFQSAVIAASILASITDIAKAVDFGTRGRTYEIEEQAFVEMIDERLERVDQNKIKQDMQKRAKERAEEPLAVEEVEPAKEGRVFYFDPSYVLEKDVYLPNGDLFYKAGTRVNPIKEMEKLSISLNRRMIFIDAREENQISWLKEKLDMYKSELNANKHSTQGKKQDPEVQSSDKDRIENRVILVGGRPFDLQEDLQEDYPDMTVYFDQAGVLTKKLGIKASPAIVGQDGFMLRIEEYKI